MVSGADAESRSSLVRLGMMVGTESEELGTQDLEANTKLRHSAFPRAESAVLPFEEREGMEGGIHQRQTWKCATGF